MYDDGVVFANEGEQLIRFGSMGILAEGLIGEHPIHCNLLKSKCVHEPTCQVEL